MIVKICGIRSVDDALGAIDSGAHMLGFNFYAPSPRYVGPGACEHILSALRKTAARMPVVIGVFVNSSAGEVAAIMERCGLDLAQLHGDEPAEVVAALEGRAFKAIRPVDAAAARADFATYHCRAGQHNGPDILFDTSAPGLYGGSGRTADWSLAAAFARQSRLLLAGGLHPGNVAEAIAAVRPWGVDVASGVESAPGVKDADKMKRFVEQATSGLAGSSARY